MIQPWKSLWMPDGGQICLVSDPVSAPIYDHNHNLYRLSKDGGVIWRVVRNEGLWQKWGVLREAAEAGNTDTDPSEFSGGFFYIWLLFADGTSTQYKNPPATHWIDGARVQCSTLDFTYKLDIETGIATNIDPLGKRPW